MPPAERLPRLATGAELHAMAERMHADNEAKRLNLLAEAETWLQTRLAVRAELASRTSVPPAASEAHTSAPR